MHTYVAELEWRRDPPTTSGIGEGNDGIRVYKFRAKNDKNALKILKKRFVNNPNKRLSFEIRYTYQIKNVWRVSRKVSIK